MTKLKYLYALWLALMCFGVYSLSKAPRDEVPAGKIEPLYRHGRAVYRIRCVGCHNSDPNLPGTVGPALKGVSKELLFNRLKNGKGSMPAQPNTLKHLEPLWEYLR